MLAPLRGYALTSGSYEQEANDSILLRLSLNSHLRTYLFLKNYFLFKAKAQVM